MEALNLKKLSVRLSIELKKDIEEIEIYGILIEIWETIILYLGIEEVLNLSSISKDIFVLFSSESIFESLLKRDFKIVNKYKEIQSYKETYKKRFELEKIIKSNKKLKEYKIILIGEEKNLILEKEFQKYFNSKEEDKFDNNSIQQKRIILNEKPIQIDIFNISYSNIYFSSNIFDMIVRTGNAFIISFNLNNFDSFKKVKIYFNLIKKSIQDFDEFEIPILIIGINFLKFYENDQNNNQSNSTLISKEDILKEFGNLNYFEFTNKNNDIELILNEIISIISNLKNPFQILHDLPWIDQNVQQEEQERERKCSIQ
eukprot:gene10382-2911_t